LILAIPPNLVAQVWPEVEPLIKKPLDRTAHGCYLPCDIFAGLVRGELLLWVSRTDAGTIEAAVVTEIRNYPRKRACNVFLVGGANLRGWFGEMNAKIEEYAAKSGCHQMEGGARRGWARVAGYREIGVTLMKELH
jgi:hypothetical protein